MASSGCVERVHYLLSNNSSASEKKSELSNVFDELYSNFQKKTFLSSSVIQKLFDDGIKISRCLEVEWCIPQAACGKYVPLR